MWPRFSMLLTICLSGSLLASPTGTIIKRADLCGQWDSVATGAYTVYNNEWGTKGASGRQCFGVDSVSGSIIKWHTTYDASYSAGNMTLTCLPLGGPGPAGQTVLRHTRMPLRAVRPASYQHSRP